MKEKIPPSDSQDKSMESYENTPERPFECSECKKPIAVHYTSIVGKTITHTLMCADCPFLQQHLKGIPVHPPVTSQAGLETGLCCGNCGTTLENIKMGSPVGCSSCYDVFGDLLISELQTSNKLPSQATPKNKKSFTLHLGRSPGELSELTPSVKLLALNEALTETLKLEDYEQAAWLRDQIREITEKAIAQKHGGKEKLKENDEK